MLTRASFSMGSSANTGALAWHTRILKDHHWFDPFSINFCRQEEDNLPPCVPSIRVPSQTRDTSCGAGWQPQISRHVPIRLSVVLLSLAWRLSTSPPPIHGFLSLSGMHQSTLPLQSNAASMRTLLYSVGNSIIQPVSST